MATRCPSGCSRRTRPPLGRRRWARHVRRPDEPAAGRQRGAFRRQRDGRQRRQQCRERNDPRRGVMGPPVDHIESHCLAQGEIAAARPDEPSQVGARAEPLADGIGQRAHVVSGGAHQAQAQGSRRAIRRRRARSPSLARAAAAPARSCARDRRRDRRRSSWPRRREAAADTSRGILQPRPRSSLPSAPTSPAYDRARQRRRRDRAWWSSRQARCRASYSLSADERNCASRVALPITSGSTPDASGSSVPVWPTFRPRMRAAQHGDDVVRGRSRRLVDDDDAVGKEGSGISIGMPALSA